MSTQKNRSPIGVAGATTTRLVVVVLAGQEYAIPAAMVLGIRPHQLARPVPGSPSHIEGVLNLRGRIVPVVSLRARAGLAGACPSRDAVTVLVESGDLAAGLVVDAVGEVLSVDTAGHEPADPDMQGAEILTGVVGADGRRLLVLDVPGILGERGPAA